MSTARESDLIQNEDALLALVDVLRQLERSFGLESRFNLFEAINMTRQEIRHSRFLAFLLDPTALHGLGDRFLRLMLVAVVSDHPSSPISKLDATIADLTGATVHCERDHFDVTVHLPSLKLLFVIENNWSY